MAASADAEHAVGVSAQLPTRQSRVALLWPAVRYCGSVYLVLRIALFLLAAAAWGLNTLHGSVTPTGSVVSLTSGWQNAITGWDKEDSLWFLRIAHEGYSDTDGSASFYPAYPILIRLVGYLCLGHLLLAAYIVANGALFGALVVLYKLTEREFDTACARRTVLYLCIFPTAFFLFDTYSEALFLLTAVASIALARQGRWGWAGLVGIGATLTRSIGVVIVLALAVEAIHQTVEDRRDAARHPSGRLGAVRATTLRLAAALLPLAGIGSYLLFWQLRFHDWYRPIRIEQTIWGRAFSPPWHTLWQGWIFAMHNGPEGGAGWRMLDFVLVAVGLMLGIWVALRTRPIYAVYTWSSLLFLLSTAWPYRPLMSDPRFLLPIFTLLWPLARLGRRTGMHKAIVALSAASVAIVGWLFLSTGLIF